MEAGERYVKALQREIKHAKKEIGYVGDIWDMAMEDVWGDNEEFYKTHTGCTAQSCCYVGAAEMGYWRRDGADQRGQGTDAQNGR